MVSVVFFLLHYNLQQPFTLKKNLKTTLFAACGDTILKCMLSLKEWTSPTLWCTFTNTSSECLWEWDWPGTFPKALSNVRLPECEVRTTCQADVCHFPVSESAISSIYSHILTPSHSPPLLCLGRRNQDRSVISDLWQGVVSRWEMFDMHYSERMVRLLILKVSYLEKSWEYKTTDQADKRQSVIHISINVCNHVFLIW